MSTFDHDNLIITLDPVSGDGTLEVNVYELYTEWKDNLLAHPDNRRSPQAFRSDGGNPLTSIINQGGYIFLNNTAGWRIKSFENDGTYYFVGNLAVEDTALPAFVPTDGAFTAAILGLQPVTQGVTPSMASQLAFTSFQNVVCIDVVNGFAGQGELNGYPIGTRVSPSNNMADALAILEREGIHTFQMIGDLTLAAVDLSEGYEFVADSRYDTLTVNASADVTNCALRNLTVSGEMDGLNMVESCTIGNVTSASGYFENCSFTSSITLTGPTYMYECRSQVAGSGYPTIDTGGNSLITRNWRGSYGLTNVTGGDHSCGLEGGRLLLDNTCSGGNVHVRGAPFDIIDNSIGTTVINEVEGMKSRDVHVAHFHRRRHDLTANTITIYAADNVTPLHVFDADDALTDITPQ